MDSVIRGLVVYLFLLIIFRIAGRQTLAQTSNFDLVLLLIISETIQQAMVDGDHSVTNGFLLVITLIGISIMLSYLKQRFPTLDKWLEGTPVIVVDHGKPNERAMEKLRLDEGDIMSAARSSQGLERMSQIKYAIAERNGQITIIPAEKA